MTLRPREPYEAPGYFVRRGAGERSVPSLLAEGRARRRRLAAQRLAFIERELRGRPVGSLVLGGPHDPDCKCFTCARATADRERFMQELLDAINAQKSAEEKAMSVRAKFKVNSIKTTDQPKSVKQPDGSYKSEPGTVTTLEMSPTYSSDPNSENKKFWDASPGGQLQLNCVNSAAVEQFKVGQEFYLDFTPVD